MNLERLLIILSLTVVGLLMWTGNVIAGLEAEKAGLLAQIAERERAADRLEIKIATLEERLRPPPYCPPLEEIYVSSGVGYRMDPMGGGTEALHEGADLVGPVGTPVRAVRDGVVVEHWPEPGRPYYEDGAQKGVYRGHSVFGGYIKIKHGEGLFSVYGHLSKTEVHTGQRVRMGDEIGELGDTGVCTGPHLHFELVVDPLKYLRGE